MKESEQKSFENPSEQGGIMNVKIVNNNWDRAEECVIKKPSSETSAGECRRSKYAKELSWERATYCSTYFCQLDCCCKAPWFQNSHKFILRCHA